MKTYLKNISDELEESNQGFIIHEVSRLSSSIPRSALKVGVLFAFRYLGRNYTAYVIATRRTRTGLYFSNRGNLLVTCLLIDLTQVSSQITLSRIYKRSKPSNYIVIKGKSYQLEDGVSDFFKDRAKARKQEINFNLFGKENFRTFKIKNMQEIFILDLLFSDPTSNDYPDPTTEE